MTLTKVFPFTLTKTVNSFVVRREGMTLAKTNARAQQGAVEKQGPGLLTGPAKLWL